MAARSVLQALLCPQFANPWHLRPSSSWTQQLAAILTSSSSSNSSTGASFSTTSAAAASGAQLRAAPAEVESSTSARHFSAGAKTLQQQADAVSSSGGAATKRLNLCNAINDALHVHLDENPKAVVLGEDVVFGGVFRCTLGLAERYGRHRVFNTPLCEQGIVGFSIGMATMGYTAVAEIQFADYIFPALDQLVNEAAKYRYRSGSTFDCGGLTVRAPCGAVGHGGHYHSQSPEAFFTHTPGLKVVMPSTPAEAKGLLIASMQEPDPVVFFEPKMLYRTAVEDVPVGSYTIPLGVGRRVRAGDDITLVGWGPQVHVLAAAAEHVAQAHGVQCDVIDLRTLVPWDVRMVEESVNRTGRLIVSHEAPLTSGFGAEIVSTITSRCFLRLEAPPLRVTGQDTPFPLIWEPLYLPSLQRVVEAIQQTIKF